MDIKIKYCVVWDYRPAAVSLAAELKREFGIDAELIEGAHGVFDVTVDGRLIFSKDRLYRFPVEGEITRLIRSGKVAV